MASEDRFKQSVIVTLAKRAANQCSNPDCGAITSGPADDPNKSINVGEAAHIYGANPGSARYEEVMESTDRGAISNAIWLCGNCHKMIDDDPTKYPSGLLFEWQREHELRVSAQVGKTGAALRRRYENRHLEELGRLSYLAERLILEKPDAWEYLLTGEALRFEMEPVVRRWNALLRGLYLKPMQRIESKKFPDWLSLRMSEALKISHAFSELMNNEFKRAWGDPGIAGDEKLILSTCRLFAEACDSMLTWEEQVRFVSSHDAFEPVIGCLEGTMAVIFDAAVKVPKFLQDTFRDGIPTGTFILDLALELPEGWETSLSRAMEEAVVVLGVELAEDPTLFQ